MPIPFAALIPAIAGIAGGLIQRGQSRRDVARQNQYNSPINQINRIKAAGLPMAAMGNNVANQQSSLPITNDGGIGSIGSYITTQQTLQQVEALKQEIRSKKVQADKDEAILTWLQELRGEDRQGTNLTNNLRIQQELSSGQSTGQAITNKLQEGLLSNQPERLSLENTKIASEISKIASDQNLVNTQIEGIELENKIKSVLAAYQPKMSEANFVKLVKENQLLDENIEGKQLSNDIDSLRKIFDSVTLGSRIEETKTRSETASLNFDVIKEHFTNYKQYQEFVQRSQDYLNNGGTLKEYFRSIGALLYTSITGSDGHSNLLQNLK